MSDEEVSSDDTLATDRPEAPPDPHSTAKPGADPLILSPKISTGLTGQIERPGDHSPPWFVPLMFVGFAVFIAGLVYVAQNRRTDSRAVDADVAAPSEVRADVAAVDSIGARDVGAATTTLDADTPSSAGTVVVAGEVFEIAAQCEVHAPFAPLDTGYQVSSYAFVDGGGSTRVLDRVFDAGTELATYRVGEFEFVGISTIGDTGGFAATFRDNEKFNEVEIVVNPALAGASDCSDRIVINEPGQFSEPHTLIVLGTCVNRTPTGVVVDGITSEGSRFDVSQIDADLVDIAFRSGSLGATTLRTDSPGSIFLDFDIVSVSGVVTDGAESLDISIDIGTEAPTSEDSCVIGERL
jgi:hypothetical protein